MDEKKGNDPIPDPHAPKEYIAASYVKFVETAGARVVAVRFNQSKAHLKEIFSKLNGILLPGGDNPIKPGTAFYAAGEALWEYVTEEDPYFPIFGVCLGMEFISSLAAGSPQILEDSGKFDASNATYNLHLTRQAYTSDLFRDALQNLRLYEAMKYKKITYNQHEFGVTPKAFRQYDGLRRDFDILATSFDQQNREFIAAMEHKTKNVFGIQFHPEKNIFEWYSNGNFPHSADAVLFSQTLANAFVSKARENSNSFGVDPETEASYLIQNHHLTFKGNSYFGSTFVFYADEPQKGLSSPTGSKKVHQMRNPIRSRSQGSRKPAFHSIDS